MFKNFTYFKKSQVTIYFICVMALLVSLAFVVIMVGKTAKDKTFADNAADSAALAACSIMAQAFNDNSADNANNEKESRENETARRHQQNANKRNYIEVIVKNVSKAVKALIPPGTSGLQEGIIDTIRKIMRNLGIEVVNVTKSWERGQENHQRQQENMREYTENAIAEGYQMCFTNSGTHHRLGRATSKLYENFLKTLQPGMVQSGEPKTFAWVDGAGRFHIVTCIVALEPTDTWVLRTAADGYSQSRRKAGNARRQYENARGSHTTSRANAITAESLFPCGFWWPFHVAMKAFNWLGFGRTNAGRVKEGKCEEGTNRETSRVREGPASPDDNIYYRDDIIHSRIVSAMNFQFHMGSPQKSTWGDVDEMTFYPPVFAVSIASFNYTGRGNIHRRGGGGSDPRHECGLISAF